MESVKLFIDHIHKPETRIAFVNAPDGVSVELVNRKN